MVSDAIGRAVWIRTNAAKECPSRSPLRRARRTKFPLARLSGGQGTHIALRTGGQG